MKWPVRILIACGLFASIGLAGSREWKWREKPRLDVVGARLDGGRLVHQLELINPTARELEYWGYGAAEPMYQLMSLEAGRWVPVSVGWCGMGAAPQRLGAGQRQRFELRSQETSETKVGLLLLPPRSESGTVYQFTWLPVAWRSHLVRWQNERLEEKLRRQVVWSVPLAPVPPEPPASLAAMQPAAMPE